jgi:signal transduction histidine kinase
VGPGFDPVLEPVVQAAAVRGERLVAISRTVFCVLVLARFLSLEQASTPAPYVLNLSALGIAIGYSLWILWRIRKSRADYWMLVVSVMVDAIGCFASLLQTVLWPASGAAYRGLLTTPDMSALLVIVYCAGFRVWPRLAAIGALLNLLSYFVLVSVELSIGGDRLGYGIPEVFMFLFVLGSVMVLSIGTARRTLGLVAAGAAATVQVDRARRKLAEIVREHHDARSVISAAALSSDMMVRALHGGSSGAPQDGDLRRQAERLREDLEAARNQLAELGEKAYLELNTLGEVERVETARVLREAVDILKIRFPELTIETELPPAARTSQADLLVVGGAPSIQRILYNLVSNARDGDGRSGASHVTARVEPRGTHVRLIVEDDGPGFGTTSLSGGPVPASTKSDGMGLGLLMTSELVRVSGGTFNAENRPDGGARLSLTLPAADVRR